MNFKLNWLSRLVLLVLFGFGGCVGTWSTPEAMREDARRHRLIAAGRYIIADMREHGYNMRYCQMMYPGAVTPVWKHHRGQWGLDKLGRSPDAGERIDIWKACIDEFNRWPENVAQDEIEYRRQDKLGGHPELQYKSQKDLTRQLKAIKAAKFAAVLEGME